MRLKKVTSLGIRDPIVEKAEALLKRANDAGELALIETRESARVGEYRDAVGGYRRIQKVFAGLPCAREAAREEAKLLADPDVKKRIAEADAAEKKAAAEMLAAGALKTADDAYGREKYALALTLYDKVAEKHPDT
ncbi:MAG: hypothetical protein ACYTFG_13245, partial [Planctomycetota bacterium]